MSNNELFLAVYEELRKLATRRLADERSSISLCATELVHEAWLRLDAQKAPWLDQGQFMAAAAVSMRRILVDRARHRNALKRRGILVPLDEDTIVTPEKAEAVDILALDEALTQLESVSDRHAKVVQLRFFAGLSIPETAAALGVSTSTIDNDWSYAKTWLRVQLAEQRWCTEV